MIPEAAVEASARAAFILITDEQWESAHPGEQEKARELARATLEAGAPHMLAEVWEAGHESGFWNGRESAGSGEMDAVGVEHAKVHNPYRSAG